MLTARLMLREWRSGEVDAVYGLLGSDATMGTGRAGRVHSLDEAQDWLGRRLQQQQEHGLTMWAAERQQDGQLIGACGLFPKDERLELAYIIDHRFWRSGYATEAARAALKAGAASRPAWPIFATIRPSNIWSLRVAETIGMRRAASVMDDRGELLVYER
jgi:RimJ/RimL family protein N-acetyltransferase